VERLFVVTHRNTARMVSMVITDKEATERRIKWVEAQVGESLVSAPRRQRRRPSEDDNNNAPLPKRRKGANSGERADRETGR
jgi:hypothetical protein